MTKTKLFLLISLVVAVVAIFWPREKFHISMVAGRRVLVTGASSGIGEQLAYQYAQAGASVFITARRAALLDKVVQNCKVLGAPNAQFGAISADMSDMEQATSVIEAAVNHLGGLDQVILNHAYLPMAQPFTNDSFHILDKALDVNVRSNARLAVQALPHLKLSHGSLAVVSSFAGKFGMSLFSSYCASKFALDGFFSAFRQEVKPFNVSVSLVVLGGIDTEKLDTIMKDIQQKFKTARDIKKTGWRPAPADLCAYEIMRGTTMREREIYYPERQFIRYLVLFRELVVHILENENLGINKLLRELH